MVHLVVIQVDLELLQLVVEEVVQNHLQEMVYLEVQAEVVDLVVVLQEVVVLLLGLERARLLRNLLSDLLLSLRLQPEVPGFWTGTTAPAAVQPPCSHHVRLHWTGDQARRARLQSVAP